MLEMSISKRQFFGQKSQKVISQTVGVPSLSWHV